MATTVAEIGKLAGCSGATVSRVINNRGYVNPEVRDAVLEIINRVQYPRTRTGRRGRPVGTLKTPPVNLVELLYFRDRPMEHLSVRGGKLAFDGSEELSNEILSDSYALSASFYRRIIDGVVGELSRWGMKGVVEFATTLSSPEAIARVNKPDRAGILLLGESIPELSRFVQSCNHPIVLVDIIESGVSADVVTTDNQTGISEAFDHLYSLGHRKIGFVGQRQSAAGFRERFASYKLKMVEAGLTMDPAWIGQNICRIDEAERVATRILSSPNRPTALMCANDVDALGIYRAAAALRIRIPDELSVVGFDDQDTASLVTPALTTVQTPMVEMGAQAVRQLMLQIRQPSSGTCCVRLVPKLVVRGSTRRLGS